MSATSTPRAVYRAAPARLSVPGGEPARCRDVVRSCPDRATRARRAVWTPRATNGSSFDAADVTIEGLVPLDQICDEFVCKSSPAVEGSLRQIATDIVALREDKRSLNPFANDLEYDDGARAFVGRDGFADHTYIRDTVGEPRAAVTRMAMDGLDRATIEWRLVGSTPGGKLDVAVTTELVMNLITGRATKCTETWDASASDASAATFLKSTRAATAIPKNVADAARRAAKNLEGKLGSAEDAGAEDVYVDPNDPMKFFTNSNKPEDDYLQYALIVAAVWLVYEGVKATATLN